jgi:hypothetical protein
MKKIVGFLSTSFVALFFLITGPVAVTSCEKEIIRDTIIVTDTLVIKDTLTIRDTVCYDLMDGLVAWYNFNGGTLKDSSGKNNHINFNNATPTTDRFGKANNAYLFNGTSSYMTVPNSVSLNPSLISIQAIVKPNGFYTGPCHGNNILSKGWPDFATGFYSMRIGTYQDCNAVTDTTKEIFAAGFGDNGNPYGSGAGVGADTPKVHTGQWYNVIYTYDGTTSKIYINGKLKNSAVKSVSSTGNNQDLFIGKHGDPPIPYWFNGVIDEIRIYNKALCEGEIKQLNQLKN